MTAAPPAPAVATTSAGMAGHERARRRLFWPFLLPALALYTLLLVVPSLSSLWVGLHRWSGLGSQMEWVGLGNYTRLLRNEAFTTAFGNTIMLTVLGALAVFGVTFAAMIVLRDVKGRTLIRSIVFVPYILSPIALGVAVGFLLNPDGAVNTLLEGIGLESLTRAWLHPDTIFSVIIVAFSWSVGGFYLALLMSGVDSIPDELYESADLAGASSWQKFRHITFPLSRDALSTAAVLWVINALKVFEIVIAFTGTAGTPPIAARTIAVQQYLSVTGGREGIPQLGAAAAIGVLMFLLSSVLVVLVRRVLASEVYAR
ncbi:MAG: carbohydrate ABC transporter permease [Arachnia sp.]